MIRHAAQLVATTLFISASLLWPFLAGDHDRFALTLFSMGEILGTVGLMLVPFGLIWLSVELRRRVATTAIRPSKDWGYRLGVIAIAASSLVAALMSLGVLMTSGLSAAIVTIGLGIFLLARFLARLRTIRTTEPRPFNPAPVYLIVLPLVAAAFRFGVVVSAAERSRNLAIENSAALIDDIGRYREAHGEYPRSLLSVWHDYKPGVVGVEQYHYEPRGDAYNLYFEHWSEHFGTREIVMYNPRDEHEMTS